MTPALLPKQISTKLAVNHVLEKSVLLDLKKSLLIWEHRHITKKKKKNKKKRTTHVMFSALLNYRSVLGIENFKLNINLFILLKILCLK